MLELPLSLAAIKSGVEGATGATVSMITVSGAFVADTLPAASVAYALIKCVPLPSALTVFV